MTDYKIANMENFQKTFSGIITAAYFMIIYHFPYI